MCVMRALPLAIVNKPGLTGTKKLPLQAAFFSEKPRKPYLPNQEVQIFFFVLAGTAWGAWLVKPVLFPVFITSKASAFFS